MFLRCCQKEEERGRNIYLYSLKQRGKKREGPQGVLKEKKREKNEEFKPSRPKMMVSMRKKGEGGDHSPSL